MEESRLWPFPNMNFPYMYMTRETDHDSTPPSRDGFQTSNWDWGYTSIEGKIQKQNTKPLHIHTEDKLVQLHRLTFYTQVKQKKTAITDR